MAGFGGTNRAAMDAYRKWVAGRIAENQQDAAFRGTQSGAITQIGGMRSIGNPEDSRLSLGGVPQAVNIPGLPPATATDPAISELQSLIQSGQAPFRDDSGREGGVQRVGTSWAPAAAMRNLAQAAEAEAARRTNLWWNAKNVGIEPVTRGDADFVGLRDSQIRTDRFDGAGKWEPTLDTDAKAIENALALTQNVRTGSADSPRRRDAPLRRRPGQVRAEEIDLVRDVLEELGVADPREDPRFLEMEEAARFVRSIPRREGYEGDPALIEGPSSSGKSWGGINPYGPLGLVVNDARGRVVTKAPGAPQLVNVYPGESTGRIRNLDTDATALWDREEDPTLGRLAQEARNNARTPVITGIGLNELARAGRFRQATSTEMQALAPQREGADNTLRGFIVQAGAKPITVNQLIEKLSNPRNGLQLQINRDGKRVALPPESAAAGFERILSVAMDPANPEFIVTPGGRFTRESTGQLPELYLEKQDGTISRLALGVKTDGAPSLLVREWAPVYESDATTTVDRAIRNSLGQPDVTKENTQLFRVGRPTNQNNAAIKEELADLLGVTSQTPLNPRSSVRPLLQGQQRGDFEVLMRNGGETIALSPEEVESAIYDLAAQAADPSVSQIAVDPATGTVVGGGPRFMIRRPDGSVLPVPVSVRPGPSPEPLIQLPGVAREVGPTFLNTSVGTRMEGAKLDADQDLYPILKDLTEAAFSEGAPVGSKQQITRELMAGLIRGGRNRDGSVRPPMTPIEAAKVIARTIAETSPSKTARQDYGNALRGAVIESTGGESRLGAEVPAPAAQYVGLAEVLDFARGLNQRERTQRVIPAGDVRERLRTRVRLAGESGEGDLDVVRELSDPVRRALEEEMAARELAGYGRGRAIEGGLDDLESDAYLAEGIGEGVQEGLPGESPRLGADVVEDVPTLADAVTASAYQSLANSSLVGRRSMSEKGPIENALKKQAQLLAEAALRAGGATVRPVMVEQVVNTPQGPQRRLTRGEQRSLGLTLEMLRALAGKMADPPVRGGSMQQWVNYGDGWVAR